MAIIKRPQHNMKLASVLNNMLQCGSLVDVTIYCDDGQVNAHKLVLAASSTYFRNLFRDMTNAFHYPIIVLREMPVNDLKTIIQFIYHGEINVPQNRVDSLMRCANYLQIDGMASSTNSLNAILASSSTMIHPSSLTQMSGPLSTTLSTAATGGSGATQTNASTLNSNLSKIHPQYPPILATTANCKPTSRGHGSRSNAHNNNNNSNNNTNSNSNNHSTSSDHSTGKSRHVCHVCLKTFTHGFTLKRHMKLHENSRLTIYCDVCSKSYSCKDSFLRHKKSSGHLQHAEFHQHRGLEMNINSNR